MLVSSFSSLQLDSTLFLHPQEGTRTPPLSPTSGMAGFEPDTAPQVTYSHVLLSTMGLNICSWGFSSLSFEQLPEKMDLMRFEPTTFSKQRTLVSSLSCLTELPPGRSAPGPAQTVDPPTHHGTFQGFNLLAWPHLGRGASFLEFNVPQP